MKILLINPPNYNVGKTFPTVLNIDIIGLYPPVGLMYIASYLRENTTFDVKILDTLVDRLTYAQIEDYVKEFNPDLIGIGSYTLTFYDVMMTVEAARKASPNAHICVGGPHTQFWHEETIKKPSIDSLVLGEGEVTFTELAKSLQEGRSLHSVQGLLFKEKGKTFKNIERPPLKDLNTLPFPAFDLVPYKKYFSAWSKESSIGVIFSSRGCPYKCTFCDKMDFKYRNRGIDNLLDEIQLYYDKGIREFMFFDDLFNITSKKVIEVSQGILKRGFKIIWTFRGRVDAITEEMVVTAKEAGCRLISLGVEDCTDEGLKLLKKGITLQQVKNAVKIIEKHNLETSTNWIIGLPRHKSKEDVKELFETAKKIDSTYVEFAALVPYYGTELFNEGVKKGVIKDTEWKEYVKDPRRDFIVPVWDEYLSREELSELYRYCYRGYYYRLPYILKSIMRVSSFHEFFKKATVAIQMFKEKSRLGNLLTK